MLTGLYAFLTWQLKADVGLTQTFFQGTGEDRKPLVERRTPAVDLTVLDEAPTLPRRAFTIRWTGVWRIPRTDYYAIDLTGRGRVTLTVDRQILQQHTPAHPAHPRAVMLAGGFHDLEIEYEHVDGDPSLTARWGFVGRPLRSFDREGLFVSSPQYPWLRTALTGARTGLRYLGIIGLVVAAWIVLLRLVRPIQALLARRLRRPSLLTRGDVVAAALAAGIVMYGALLRFDALTLTYGPVDRPGWLQAVQQTRGTTSLLRPDAVTWSRVAERYISEPATHLEFARGMRSFYAAHHREPLFPAVTKGVLWLLNQQDVAVSVASALFSVLAIFATFLLGAYAFSYAVGLGAALALAIEYDAITWGIGGWREDAFTCAVVLFAYTLVRFARVPDTPRAIAMGVVAGVACLINVMSLAFVLPGLAAGLVAASGPLRHRLVDVATAFIVAALIAGPFVFTCWWAYGDPLRPINVRADLYHASEGPLGPGRTAAGHVVNAALNRPMRTMDALAVGMTSGPFQIKWHGFNPWSPAIARWLSWAAIAGVVLFLGSVAGRVLLVVMASSLVPLALMARPALEWRLTEHAYPFFLIAACFAIGCAARLATSEGMPQVILLRPARRSLLAWGLVAITLVIGVWTVRRSLPVWTSRETLSAGEPITVMAGARDAWFFESGWSRPLTEGNVTARISRGQHSTVRLTLPRVGDYDLTLRIDPFPHPIAGVTTDPTAVRVFVNDHLVSRLDLRFDPERVGTYDVHVPSAAIKAGVNRLTFVAEAKRAAPRLDEPVEETPGEAAHLRLWYVRIRERASK